MALTKEQKIQYHHDVMRELSNRFVPIALSKSELKAITDKVAEYLDSVYVDSVWDSMISTVKEKDPQGGADLNVKKFAHAEYLAKVSTFVSSVSANVSKSSGLKQEDKDVMIDVFLKPRLKAYTQS
jgi:hypothetical protein